MPTLRVRVTDYQCTCEHAELVSLIRLCRLHYIDRFQGDADINRQLLSLLAREPLTELERALLMLRDEERILDAYPRFASWIERELLAQAFGADLASGFMPPPQFSMH